jgi:hypothetical protein
VLALLDGFVAQGLGQVGFVDAGWAQEQDVFTLAQVGRRPTRRVAGDGWTD